MNARNIRTLQEILNVLLIERVVLLNVTVYWMPVIPRPDLYVSE
jgi:hypothetical protein